MIDHEDVEVVVPASLVVRRGPTEGVAGKGSFSFRVVGEAGGGNVRVSLFHLGFETENRADKTYRDMVGENKAPEGLEDDLDDDDGTDVV